MLNYFQIEDYIKSVFMKCDGKINKIISTGYEFDYSDSNILAGEKYGFISFYPKKIREVIDKYINTSEQCTQLLIVTIHELSHINQTIDYKRYMRDSSYKNSIEYFNQTATFSWILSNLHWLKSNFPEIDENMIMYASKPFSLDTFRNKNFNNTKFIVSRFIKEPYTYDSVENICIELSIFPNFDNNISNAIFSNKFAQVKINGFENDSQELYEIMQIINGYSQYFVNNDITNGILNIVITVFEADLVPQQIMYNV